MGNVFSNIGRALESLLIPRVIKIVLLSIVLNTVLIFLLFKLGFVITEQFIHIEEGWMSWAFLLLEGIVHFLFGAFLWPILLPVVVSFFAESLAEAIEEKEYPNVPVPQPPFWPNIFQEVSFVGKVLLLNLLCLPLYFIPLINIITYYLLNGYLIGTEFFNIVAGRHIERKEARIISRTRRWQVIVCGILITFAATLPFVNLVAPVLGVALMVHFFHSLNPKYKVLLTPEKSTPKSSDISVKL